MIRKNETEMAVKTVTKCGDRELLNFQGCPIKCKSLCNGSNIIAPTILIEIYERVAEMQKTFIQHWFGELA